MDLFLFIFLLVGFGVLYLVLGFFLLFCIVILIFGAYIYVGLRFPSGAEEYPFGLQMNVFLVLMITAFWYMFVILKGSYIVLMGGSGGENGNIIGSARFTTENVAKLGPYETIWAVPINPTVVFLSVAFIGLIFVTIFALVIPMYAPGMAKGSAGGGGGKGQGDQTVGAG